MIILVYGNIGSGKTHNTIRHELIPALKKGRKVYTNIDGLDPRKVGQYLKSEMPAKWRYWSSLMLVDDAWLRSKCQLHTQDGTGLEIEPHSTIIVDEAQMVWNSREFKGTSKAFIDLLAYSRHHDIDFVFLTQHPKLLEVVVTRLANQFQHCENMGFLGSIASKGYRVLYKRAPEDKADYQSVFTYDPAIFALYKSSKVPEELRAGKLAFAIKAAAFLAAALFIYTIASYNGDNYFYRFLTGNKSKTSKTAVAAPKAPQKTNGNGPSLGFRDAPATSIPPPPKTSTDTLTGAEMVLLQLQAWEREREQIAEDPDAPPRHAVVYSNRRPDPAGYVMQHTDFHGFGIPTARLVAP